MDTGVTYKCTTNVCSLVSSLEAFQYDTWQYNLIPSRNERRFVSTALHRKITAEKYTENI
jgi:hypothetical protein